jgi:hypothetical protein
MLSFYFVVSHVSWKIKWLIQVVLPFLSNYLVVLVIILIYGLFFVYQNFDKNIGRVTKPMCHPVSDRHASHMHVHVRCEGLELSLFWTTSESEQDFGAIILLFSVALLSRVQLENNRVMLLKFHSDSLLITNPCFIGHSWVGLGPILSYRHV